MNIHTALRVLSTLLALPPFLLSCNPPPSSAIKSDSSDVIRIDADDYLKPSGTPFEWKESHTDEAMNTLPKKCNDSDSGQDQVALYDGPDCKLFRTAEARPHIAKVGGSLAKYGTDFIVILKLEEERQAARAADPKLPLEAIIKAQGAINANKALDDGLLDDMGSGWRGMTKVFNEGSRQFAVDAKASYATTVKDGLGIRVSTEVSATVFASQKKALFASVEATLLKKDEPANIKPVLTIFGKDLSVPSWEEKPIDSKTKSLAKVAESYKRGLTFELGPIPFNISIGMRVNGDIPLTYTIRAEAITVGFNPNISSDVSLEGGPSIVVAKAGVEGSLNLLAFALDGNATAQFAVQNGKANICTARKLDFNMNNILGGKLSAYVEVGRPDKKLLGRKLGWRGDHTFIDIKGRTKSFAIVRPIDKCTVLFDPDGKPIDQPIPGAVGSLPGEEASGDNINSGKSYCGGPNKNLIMLGSVVNYTCNKTCVINSAGVAECDAAGGTAPAAAPAAKPFCGGIGNKQIIKDNAAVYSCFGSCIFNQAGVAECDGAGGRPGA